MKLRLAHPLWTHLPAAGALVALLAMLAASGPLPASAPVHFGFSGAPDRYGSPWLVLGLTVGLSVFYIAMSVFLDEMWARQERGKSFNWLSLFDEVVVGSMVGTDLAYLSLVQAGGESLGFAWEQALLVGGSATLLAAVLEMARPFRAWAAQPAEAGDAVFEKELERRLKGNGVFVYWDSQNPLYVTVLTVGLPVVMVLAGALSWLSGERWPSMLLVVLGLALIIPYGGQRTLVTRREVVTRFGVLGIPVLRLKVSDLVSAEVHDFSPLKDFGGYGIRFNREMKAYFLSGSRGVKLTTAGGKKYLIGSDHPERLAAVIRATLAYRQPGQSWIASGPSTRA